MRTYVRGCRHLQDPLACVYIDDIISTQYVAHIQFVQPRKLVICMVYFTLYNPMLNTEFTYVALEGNRDGATSRHITSLLIRRSELARNALRLTATFSRLASTVLISN